jgi:predicted MFS family arabinose efflux permease
VIALTLYVQDTHGTGTAVAALLIAEGVPRLFGPILGGLAERHELRRLMVGADLGQAVLFAAIALLPPFGLLLALTALTSFLQTVYSPARTTVVPALVEDDELLVANALTGAASNLFIVVGPLVGAGGLAGTLAAAPVLQRSGHEEVAGR